MKAITICQPYAHLIAIGQKFVENRSWPTKYRGPLLIHAGKSLRWTGGHSRKQLGAIYGEPLDFGAIVATATLYACLRVEDVQGGDLDGDPYPFLSTHSHVSGPWCWVLTDVERIEPVAMQGHQGLFNVAWPPPQACRICGCTETQACPGGCWWVEPDLCSACAEAEMPFDHPK